MGHSKKCPDPTTYWDRTLGRCAKCAFRAGKKVTPNCGFDDDGGRHEAPFRNCSPETFNDGTRADCLPCSPPPPGCLLVSPCNTTADTRCDDEGPTSPSVQLAPIVTTSTPPGDDSLTVPLAVGLVVAGCLLVAAVLLFMKRKKDALMRCRRSSYTNPQFSPLQAPAANLEEVVRPNILSAPLQSVLDDLDVLEELVILLDPEIQGRKNTKHLASQCSFPSTWITYTYSMKDSKSPLKAVLQGVTSRNPDWTVGHLVELLRNMGRNDAIAVLAKLRPAEMEV